MTSGLPCCDAKIQKRGQAVEVFEGEASSSSSCESEEEPSFFRFVRLRSDVIATEPDAAGTEWFKMEERKVIVCFLRHPWLGMEGGNVPKYSERKFPENSET